MNGVLIWKVPRMEHLTLQNGSIPTTATERNIACKELIGNDMLRLNHVVILVNDEHYYVAKNKVTGALGMGEVGNLAAFISELEAVSE